MNTGADSPESANALDEYHTLRDETSKRVDARNQILSYTLVFAASMLSLGLGTYGYKAALLVYPIVSFFFAIAFAYNSLMLIEIGQYLRVRERRMTGLGWATYLKGRYARIEPFEVISTSGLFVGTQFIAILLYATLDLPWTLTSIFLTVLSVLALGGTIFSIIYPVRHHRAVLLEDSKPRETA